MEAQRQQQDLLTIRSRWMQEEQDCYASKCLGVFLIFVGEFDT